MDFGTFVATSTALVGSVATTMFDTVFTVIKLLLPYAIGLVVVSIGLSVCWRLIGKAHKA